MIETTYCPTPLGTLELGCAEGALTVARFVPAEDAHDERPAPRMHPLLTRAVQALERYFATGELDTSLPLAPRGTPFQHMVWSRVAQVTAGTTATYGEIARSMGAPRSVRAVGAAVGRNPLCIFIPCHRIVGTDGAMTGYAWGVDRKRALLRLEREGAGRQPRAA